MTKGDFLDLLRYYLSELPRGVVDEIVEEYNLHFEEGKEHGKTEEEISENLGSPKDIALEYLNCEKSQRKNTNDQTPRKNGFFRDGYGNINWAAIILLILVSPIVFPLGIAFIAMVFALGVSIVAIGFSSIVAGGAVILGTFFPFLPFITMGQGFRMLSPITKILIGLTALVIGIIVVRVLIKLFSFIIGKIRDRYETYKWRRSRR
ncbi:DUF1700 domain-containing protein [Lagierella sp.]|uniref:DUF1700 domain-containing protein n=1 Tax=Lagierella sp. TaxID=2849657 RepID=UPI002632169F|nr:DUF1700 domain-containing protein [Lagierella sp.]